MASFWSVVVLTLGLGQDPALPSDASHPVRGEGSRAASLVAQLGSNTFREREAASRALNSLGAAALHALRQADRDADLEVRRRAAALVRQIRRRLETAQILEPKRIRLAYEDTPLAEAVDDLSRKTGFAIRLGPRAAFGSRTVTLDTGETTFWQALDQFCRKAGLVEWGPTASAGGVTIQMWNPNGAPVPPVAPMRHRFEMTGAVGGELILVDGPSRSLPTCYIGAVRIRALPAETTSWPRQRSPGETLLVLDVTPQPLMGWEQLGAIRITRALDEQDHVLTPVPAADAPVLAVGRFPGGMSPTYMGQPMNLARERAIRLKLADHPSRRLREVEGIVEARVRTPLQPVISVENVLQATGQTVSGSDGSWLKVLEARRLPAGIIKLRIRLADPLQARSGWALNAVAMRRRRMMMAAPGLAGGGAVLSQARRAGELGLELADSHGRDLPLVSTGTEDLIVNGNGNGLSWDAELIYRAPDDPAEPAKLVYSARRDRALEIPFKLKDVPLP